MKTRMSKFQKKMNAEEDLSKTPECPPQTPMDHPHKVPDASTPAPSSEEGKDHRSSKKKYVLNLVNDVEMKLATDEKPIFIPLSIGKAFNDLYWRIERVKMIPGSDKFLSLDVKYFVDGESYRLASSIFKASPEEVYKLTFLATHAMCMMQNLSPSRMIPLPPASFQVWFDSVCMKYREDLVCGSVLHAYMFWTNIFIEKSNIEVSHLKKCIFFCKKVHTPLVENLLVLFSNPSCIVCNTAKPDFKSEFRCRIFAAQDIYPVDNIEHEELTESQAS